ncbi:MAG: hypothetical protein JWP08_3237 [Bryobacterales bacterium]|nr:hypothetical protein [Bryobacterales bacterium]
MSGSSSLATTSQTVHGFVTLAVQPSHPMPNIVIPGSRDEYFPVGARWQTTSGYLLIFRSDGDLHLFSPITRKIWSTATGSLYATRLRMQLDGNL